MGSDGSERSSPPFLMSNPGPRSDVAPKWGSPEGCMGRIIRSLPHDILSLSI